MDTYTIAQLNNMVDEGYTISNRGEIIEPVTEATTSETTETASEFTSTIITIMSTTATTVESDIETTDIKISSVVESETTADTTIIESDSDNNKSSLPIVITGIGVVTIGGVGAMVLRKKKNNK